MTGSTNATGTSSRRGFDSPMPAPLAGALALAFAAPLGAGYAAAAPWTGSEPPQGTVRPLAQGPGTTGPGFRLAGDLLVGVRLVDDDGSRNKFREDIDLDDGFRLTSGSLVLLPYGEEPAGWFDEIRVEGGGLFGDPYESWGVSARKASRYRLEVRGRNVDYFNDFAGAAHGWDLARSNTTARLTVNPIDNLEVWGAVDRFRQTGLRRTTRDISREEFELDEDVDQDATTWSIGARWRRGATTVFVDQQFRRFDGDDRIDSDVFNPGMDPGEASLSLIEQREVRSFDAPVTRIGGGTTAAGGRVVLSGDFLFSDQDLDFRWDRRWEGADFAVRPVQVTQEAIGSAQREIRHGNVRALWRATDQVSLVARYRRRDWSQTAESATGSTQLALLTGTLSSSSEEFLPDYDVTLDQVLVGAELAASEAVSVFVEVGISSRDQRFDIEEEEESETDTVAFKLGTRIRPSRRFDVEASYERGDIDDPFTRVSPTESNLLKVKTRLRPGGGWQLAGTMTYRDLSNDVTAAQLETLGFGLNVAYRPAAERWLIAGYARQDYDSSVAMTFRPFFAGSTTQLADARLDDNAFTFAGEYRVDEATPLVLLGRVSYVSSEALLPDFSFLSRGLDHEVRFSDWSLGARYLFGQRLYAQLIARFVDYQEDTELASDVDDYDAGIYTLGLGYRF